MQEAENGIRADRLFDKPVGADHPLWAAWDVARRATNADLRACAANFAMDARLTPESEVQCSLNIAHHANEAGDGGLLTGLSKVWQARFLQLRGNVCFAGHTVRWAAHRELTHVDDFGALLGRALGSSQDNHADIVQVFAAVTGTSTLVPAWGQRPGNQQVDTIVQALHHAAEDDLRDIPFKVTAQQP